ncbi:hypothetical protein GCM10007386_30450 [Pseudoduganella dura]|nr:hypothetical protein GCM10007386_30450 [Pseudoduganella dura]
MKKQQGEFPYVKFIAGASQAPWKTRKCWVDASWLKRIIGVSSSAKSRLQGSGPYGACVPGERSAQVAWHAPVPALSLAGRAPYPFAGGALQHCMRMLRKHHL